MDDTPHADVLGSSGRKNPGLRRPWDPAHLRAELSHELRPPLTSILVYAWLLADNPHKRLSDEEVGFAAGIHQAASALLQRINDLLEMPRTPLS
jgi:signal transduction histidine kinase